MKRKILLFCLAVAAILSLSACGGTKPGDGIRMEPDVPAEYAAETRDAARSAIAGILTSYAESVYTSPLPVSVRETLADYASRVESVFADEGIPESNYRAFFANLAQSGAQLASEIRVLAGKSEVTIEVTALEETFFRIADDFSAEGLGRIAFGCVSEIYDALIQSDLRVAEENETVPALNEYYKARAAEKTADLAVFRSIGAEPVGKLLKTALLWAKFSTSDGGIASLAAFTDAELASLLRAPDLSVTLTDAQWLFLIGKAAPLSAEFAPLWNVAYANGDGKSIAARINDAVALAESLRARMTPELVALLRAGKTDALLGALCRSLTDGEKVFLEKIASLRLRNAAYTDAIAKNESLSAFFDAEPAEIEDLSAATDDRAVLLLRGILRGIFYD